MADASAINGAEFVKKLYKMLATPSMQDIVCWSPTRDSFMVKDTNQFTKSVLPKLFKHSNFASFVRQLNKYDFHKVKNSDVEFSLLAPESSGEQAWTFRHPHFRADHPEDLENVKRKVPKVRSESHPVGRDPPEESASSMVDSFPSNTFALGKGDVDSPTLASPDLGFVDSPTSHYPSAAPDLSLAKQLLGTELSSSAAVEALQQQLQSYRRSVQAQFQAYEAELASLRGDVGLLRGELAKLHGENDSQKGILSVDPATASENLSFGRDLSSSTSNAWNADYRPQTQNPLGADWDVQRSDVGPSEPNDDAAALPVQLPTSQKLSPSSTLQSLPDIQQVTRSRGSTHNPDWMFPPRVLLVDDDPLTRKLSSKLLQVFGCTFDVAVDGLAAIDKMNNQKYDLVLMDIAMPNLDGATATSLIRTFDHNTPIISMTSSSRPSEVMSYFSSGMNDILPKPFTKQGLLDMLEKHLLHLKVIEHLRTATPTLNLTSPFSRPFVPGSNTSAEPVSSSGGDGNQMLDGGQTNPLAGLGWSDEQYDAFLEKIITSQPSSGLSGGDEPTWSEGTEYLSGNALKRESDAFVDERDTKRSRIEEVI